jgi:carboxyl-terminal processing protease
MTIQKFYRVNGGSTQIEGVYSDIAMPNKYSYMKFGERDLSGALIWDKVPQAKYTKTNSYENFSDVVNKSKNRIASNEKFKLINRYAKWLKENQENTSYSLNFKAFSQESALLETASKKYTDAFKHQSKLNFKSPKYEFPLMEKDSVLLDKRTAWHKNLAKDIYVTEALNVLKDLKLKNTTEVVRN